MTGMVKQKVLEELNRSGNIAGPFLRLIERVVAVKILITFLKYLDLVGCSTTTSKSTDRRWGQKVNFFLSHVIQWAHFL